MNLVIDVGNTRLKAGIFQSGELVEIWESSDKEEISAFLKKKKPANTIICKVNNQFDDILEYICSDSDVYHLTPETQLPIINTYKSPKTLGMDRLAAVTGAYALYPEKNNLVVDLGTCITYDFITSDGKYLGGGISPGMKMRFNAMHKFTNALPMVEIDQAPDLIGYDTQTCMKSGVFHGVRLELEGIIREYREKFVQINVIFCGGDAKFFESSIKATIFVNQHLTLQGLNKILEEEVKD
ncbi:type III pantothenate kinase [Chondrinema litorale]|uniref:type III pantothenate kinase n=1 Tax=Chondrinema litorale TaxID=2994555 RepID=UPI002543BF75|nr:type III pantothenate kinase [Chondrinema litorale]UZR92632.1 type III pantothenate kinase [Chondrinema litorale]